jgi:hypothetical protein
MKRVLILGLMIVASVLLPREGEAARSRYGKARQIRVCNLLVPSTARMPGAQAYAPQGQNRSPFLWHVADRRTDIKPDDWEFVNPLAPPVLNQAQIARWQRIGLGSAAAGRTFAIGSPLTPDMAPYWEVVLAPENIQALMAMDIVYISAAGPGTNAMVSFTLAEREMLRRLADSGTLVWIDNAGDLRINNTRTAPGDFFVPLDFTPLGGGPLAAVEIGHPLLNSVFRLTSAEIRQLGAAGATGGINVWPSGIGPEPVLIPVVQGNSPSIAAARYGSGVVLATAGNVGRAVSWLAGAGGSPNNFAFSRTDLTLGQNEDLKLLYNVVGWTAESPQFQRSPRHPAATSAAITGMMERWSLSFVIDPPTPAEREAQAPNWVPPLLARDLFYGVLPRAGRYSLHALEIEPYNDFNGDGNPDDGPPALRNDFARGRAYDEIGRVDLPLSYVAGIAEGEKNGIPFLFVSGGGPELGNQLAPGTVLAYPAPRPGSPTFGAPAIFERAQPSNPLGRTLYAPPVFANGVLYACGGYPGAPGNTTGSEGIIRALDLTDTGLIERWHYPGSNAATSIGPIVGPPVVARVQDSRTGAVDECLFFTSVHSAASPGGLGGIVISTTAEPLQAVNDSRTWAPNRRTEPWDPQQWWDIRVVNNVTGVTAARYMLGGLEKVEFNVDNQPGRIRLPVGWEPAQFSVYADYSMSGPQDAGSRLLTRRYWLPAFTVPGQTPIPTGVAGGPAVGPDDTVYYATGNGYIAAAQFVGGIPVLRWKVRTANAAPYTGQSNLVDPRNPRQFEDFQFVAAPAVGNDVAYFAGRDGVVYAFETTTNFTMKVPSPNLAGQPQRAPMSSSRGSNLILYSNEATQPRTNRVPPDSYLVNADAGTVTITNFRNLTLDMSQVQRYPQLGGRLGIALDVDYIDVNGNQVQDTCFLPFNLAFTFTAQRLGGPATRFSTPPVIAGDRVYVAAENGVLYEFPADPRASDPSFPTGGDVAAFKQGALVRSRELSPNPVLAPPVVGNGTVAVATAEGITAFRSPRVSVADGNRIVEVAADSSALSATEATVTHHLLNSEFPIPTDPELAVLPQGASIVTSKKDLNRPAKVVRLNRQRSIVSAFTSSNVTEAGTIGEHSEIAETSTLVADTGNNRVVEFNPSGKVVWEATQVQDPFRLLPPGESLKLSEPHDVQRWVDTAPDPQNPNGPPLLVFHTLIADTGNRRVIEVVDKVRYRRGQFTSDSYVTLPGQVDYQGNPVRWYHVVVWASQTNAQGLSLAYRTAQRVPMTDASGLPLRNPGRPAGTVAPAEDRVAPYLAPDPYQSATLVSVLNTQVWFDRDPQSPNYRNYTLKNIPLVRPGGDSIFFLRSNPVEPDTGHRVPLRAPEPGAPEGSTNTIYVMGTIDTSLPVFRELWAVDAASGRDEVVHTLKGVSSVQRTAGVRRLIGSGGDVVLDRAAYYLVADAGGVFEFRFDASRPAPPPGSQLDPRVRLVWAFTNDDYNWCTGGGNGNRDRLREPGAGPNAGRYVGGRGLTAASAQRLASGQVLIVSRTTSNPDAQLGPQGLGGDIFTLRASDYNPAAPGGGWAPDRWVQIGAGVPQNQQRSPSITWRAPAPLNPALPPNANRQLSGAVYNPLELGGTYVPEQPTFADLVF